MTEKILALLFLFIKSVVAATGYGGIALLMAIESACIPLPSELIMPFAGYLVYQGTMKLFWVATAGAIGCNLGSLVAYEIGCYGGRPLVEKYGRWILMGGANWIGPIAFFSAGDISPCSLRACCRWSEPSSRCRPGLRACLASASTSTLFWVPGPGAWAWPGWARSWAKTGGNLASTFINSTWS
jgi:hypothetical protein